MRTKDSPVKFEGDDILGRDDYARLVALELDELDATDGVVAAITGPWGNGKTSFFNLISGHLPKGITTWEFNPWFYSSSEGLLSRFLVEFGRRLSAGDSRQKAIADKLRFMSRALQPLEVIPFAGSKAKSLGDAAQATAELLNPQLDVQKLKNDLNDLLKDQDQKYLIFIDDVDRLEEGEIRDVLKLVRLVANFRNVIFLLAYDQERVVDAIGREDGFGQEYLEKIVFVSYRLPDINRRQIREFLEVGLNELRTINSSNASRMITAMEDFVLPNAMNIRKAKRFLVSLRLACATHYRDVDLVDLVLLEATRIFSPDLFRLILIHQTELAWSVQDLQFLSETRKDTVQAVVQEILGAKPGKDTEYLIRELFPVAWSFYDRGVPSSTNLPSLIANQRVGYRDILLRVLEHYDGPESEARRKLEEVRNIASRRELVLECLLSLDSDHVELVAEMLAEIILDFPPTEQCNLVSSLFSLAGHRYQSSRFFSFGVPGGARRALSLVLSEGDVEDIWTITCFSAIDSWKGKYLFVRAIETRQGDPEPLVSENLYDTILVQYREFVLGLSSSELAADSWVLTLLIDFLDRTGVSRTSLADLLETPDSAWGLLRSSMNETLSGRDFSEIEVIPRMSDLETVLGGERGVRKLLSVCSDNPTDEKTDLKKLHALEQALSDRVQFE